jgi:hypothetical protein
MPKKSKKQTDKKEYEINNIITSFSNNLAGINLFVKNVTPIAESHDRQTTEHVENVFRNALTIAGITDDMIKDGKVNFDIHALSNAQKKDFIKCLSGLPRFTPPQLDLLYKSSFVMLLSYFDFLLGDLIRYFYHCYPESLSGKDLSLSLDDLRTCCNVDEAMDLLINNRIESLLYQNLDMQKKHLKEYMKIEINEDFINWNTIKEAVERRNIIVHNNAQINRRYLQNVDLSVFPEGKKKFKENEKISIDPKYFTTVSDEISITGIVLSQNCWRKWKKEEAEIADRNLNDLIYDFLKNERWPNAERLGLFSKKCEIHDAEIKLYIDINYCQSLKWQNKKAMLEKELTKFDESTLSPIYKIAIYALKSDKDRFYGCVDNAITVDKIKETDFFEWPLFRELREDPNYSEKIKASFKRTVS